MRGPCQSPCLPPCWIVPIYQQDVVEAPVTKSVQPPQLSRKKIPQGLIGPFLSTTACVVHLTCCALAALPAWPLPARLRCQADFTLKPVEWNDEDKLYPETMALRQKNPDLKILIAVGGWCATSPGKGRRVVGSHVHLG